MQDAELFLKEQIKGVIDNLPHQNTNLSAFFAHLLEQIVPQPTSPNDSFVGEKGLWATPTKAVTALGIHVNEGVPNQVEVRRSTFQLSVHDEIKRAGPEALRKALSNRFSKPLPRLYKDFTTELDEIVTAASNSTAFTAACGAASLQTPLLELLTAHTIDPSIPKPVMLEAKMDRNERPIHMYMAAFALMRYRHLAEASVHANPNCFHSRQSRKRQREQVQAPERMAHLDTVNQITSDGPVWHAGHETDGIAPPLPPSLFPQADSQSLEAADDAREDLAAQAGRQRGHNVRAMSEGAAMLYNSVRLGTQTAMQVLGAASSEIQHFEEVKQTVSQLQLFCKDIKDALKTLQTSIDVISRNQEVVLQTLGAQAAADELSPVPRVDSPHLS